ncbi:UNKNOWN [Stylonychia lemnae]|uniref:Transmembrane protein n=1 Tax=Stylonychia lemnae TaxID=5949 RepID=A0A078APU7_STYLE|nr:UNKNOWN [Stylonychia lemnae]|eukprot:CDW82963.1 UNKNOWN [Stylonychia lemnae]
MIGSLKGISFISMAIMIGMNPQNAIKISFSHFCFNLSMAILSLIFPYYMKNLIEVSLPFKGSITGAFFFTFFKNVPSPILLFYEWLVYLICNQDQTDYSFYLGPLYGLFEMFQLINLAFIFSRYFQKKIDFERSFFQQIAPMMILIVSITTLGLSLKNLYDMTQQELFVSKFSLILVISFALVIIVCINAYCIIVDYEDGIVSNSCMLSLYFSYVLQSFWQAINTFEKSRLAQTNQVSQTFEQGIYDLWDNIKVWQKRGSQYLTSFLIGSGGYNIDGFSENIMGSPAFMTTIKIVILFMTLPMTVNEWPWIDQEERKKAEQLKLDSQQPQHILHLEQDEYNSRLAHASTYLMNALLVLMTTNYTLNPQFYFLGRSDQNEGGALYVYFPLLQIFIGIIYFIIKILQSDQ